MPHRFRPRARRVVAPVLVLAVLAVATALTPKAPHWLALAPVLAAVAAALPVADERWIKPWAERRRTEADTQRAAIDRLRMHLGRQDGLRLMDDPATNA